MKYLEIRKIVSAALIGTMMVTVAVTPPELITSASTPEESQSAIEHLSETYEDNMIVSTVIPNGTVIAEPSTSDEVDAEVQVQEALEKEIKAELKERARREAIRKQKEYIASIVCDPSNVSRVSGLKKSDYYLLTKGTWWEGNEEALIRIEEKYGVNAMFAMAVSTLESGSGTSDRAHYRRNYYGIETSKVWSNLYYNTQYWANLISKYYVHQGRRSVESISTKYCPPNSAYWASFNRAEMKKLYNQLITRLYGTIR